MLRALYDVWNHLVEGGQAFFCLEIMSQIVFFALFEPLLCPVVEFPEKMCADFVVEDSFDGETRVPDGQSDDHCAHGFDVVVHHACAGYGVLGELVVQVFAYLQFFYVLLEVPRSLLHAQGLAFSN
jgi:hypothetical protein